MAPHIDLNADVGEGYGIYRLGDDEALFAHLTSVNVACGFHAGDPRVIDATVRRAVQAGLAVGAHPGTADRRGFGRRAFVADPAEVEADVLYQVAAVDGFARAHGTPLVHVKPHGALYNQAMNDALLARRVARAVARLRRDLVLVGLASSAVFRRAAEEAGLRFAGEAFADRGYAADGSLLPRDAPGALITDAARAAEQALRLACDGVVVAADGTRVEVRADTLCVHGDTPGAAAIAGEVRRALEDAGVRLAPLAP